MAKVADVNIAVAAPSREEFSEQLSPRMWVGSVLGPLAGLALWFAPIQLEPVAHQTLAIVAFMIVYWITEPIDHGITAMIGCFLFWALHIADFETAFAGFANSSPWFLFGAMLMGEAAAQSGLAKRIGFLIMRYLGTSYSRLLLSVVVFVFILNFLVPSGLAQLAIVAPMIVGIIAAFGVGPQSNIARGLFVILAYTCGLFNKMILAGGASILTRGIVEKLTGEPIYWSKYFIAYLPADLITIFACWLTILWLYPPEKKELPGGRQYLEDEVRSMGPWTLPEKKTLAWLLLAVGLWATDLWHKTDPAVIALGVGLMVALPKIGMLKTRDIQRVNFLLIIFMAGALSIGGGLAKTKALVGLPHVMVSGVAPYLCGSFPSRRVLFWAGLAFPFLIASEL